MKNKGIIFSILSLPVLLGGVVGCGTKPDEQGNKDDVSLVSIAISGTYKSDYHYGEGFERPTVIATYSDNSTYDVTLYVKVSGFNSLRVGTQTVVLTYDTQSTTYEVNVVNEIKGIIVSGQKTAFEVGEEFSLGGGLIQYEYDDGSHVLIDIDFTYEGFDSSEVASSKKVTIKVGSYSFEYEYQVVASTEIIISSLEFSNIKTSYIEGEEFVRPTATANGTIDVSDYVSYVYDMSVGTHVVTGTYKGVSNTFEIIVSPNSGDAETPDIPSDSISGKFTIKNKATSEAVEAVDGVYTITEIGEYDVSGKLEEGQIIVNVPEPESLADNEEDVVVLNLNGTSISSTNGCPIHVITCRDIEISSKNGKNNYLYDHSSLKDETNDPYGAAIYVENGDLKLKGKGKLLCASTNNNGIHGKDDVKIQKMNLMVKAVNNGIKGNDSISIKEGAIIDIECGDDGLKTSNNGLSNKGKQKGNIEIIDGNITINSWADGIDAEYDVIIADTIDEETSSVTASPIIDIFTNIYSSYNSNHIPSGTYVFRGNSSKASDSAKGIKAIHEVNISGGTINCKAYDDGIHGNATSDDQAIIIESTGEKAPGNVTISGGEITISASDDGIHADGTLVIKENADISVTKSYEGLEGHIINFEGGKATIFATDDGVNAPSSTSRTTDGQINISGGYLDVTVPSDKDRDGIDSNGTYTQTGGTVIVRGPANGGAWSLDADSTVTFNSGTIIIVGGIEASSSGGNIRPAPGGWPGGGGGHGGATLVVGSNMTKSTSSIGLGIGEFAVSIGGSQISYVNSYNYSGSVIIYSELGSAAINKK